jgi:hypothetical protein
MSEERKQHITLQLDAHKMSLNVDASKEGIYREAAKTLNSRYEFYLHRMPQASSELLWVYVALETAIALRSDARDKALEPIEKRLQSLNQLLEEKI